MLVTSATTLGSLGADRSTVLVERSARDQGAMRQPHFGEIAGERQVPLNLQPV